MVRVTIVYDNVTAAEPLKADHGFACVVDLDDRRILFDGGAHGAILLRNLEQLGVAADSFDAVFLSHAHWDHVGGIPAVLEHRQVPVWLPASAKVPAGMEQPVAVEGPGPLADGVYSTGQLSAIDYPLQEHSMAAETPSGLLVIVGCAHPGVGAILDAASRFGEPRALLGGLHGFRDFARLSSLDRVCPAHCTKHGDELAAARPDAYEAAGVGAVFEF